MRKDDGVIIRMEKEIKSGLIEGYTRDEIKSSLVSVLAGYEPNMTILEFFELFQEIYNESFHEFIG